MSNTNRVVGLFAVTALAMGGCAGGVDRTVVVKSEPPGALVYMNGQEVGRTPAEVPILWYGTYDLRLREDGYSPVVKKARVWAPWWQIPPFDLIAELVPFHLEDRHLLSYEMTPLPERVELSELLARAATMRDQLQSSEYRAPKTQPTTQPEK